MDDPDPYGVKALEAEGMFIREAGSKVRPSHDAFEFRPNPSSPVYATFSRRSLDSSPRNSWRASGQSYASVDRGTQTNDAPLTALTSVSRASSQSTNGSAGGSTPNTWEEEDGSRWDTVPIHGGEGKVEGIKEEGEEEENAKDRNGHAKAERNPAIESDDDIEVHEVITNATPTKQESPEDQADAADSRRLRDSTSPTALSHTSRSTEQTDAVPEAIESTDQPAESAGLLPTVKTLQTNTAVPAVVDEVDVNESDTEVPADKDEFLSARGDNEDDAEPNTLAEDVSVLQALDTQTGFKESVAEAEDSKADSNAGKQEVKGAEDVLSQLEEKFPSPQVESPTEKLDIGQSLHQLPSSNNLEAPEAEAESSDDTIEMPAEQKLHTPDISPKTQEA
ncbi:uncharacterized protein N7482_002892 [Penicillium canariense]|uniref:Uncharacterized protein n=1 Tax=Penicillium canariense TaxID=189055 RepID=A0A9W9IH00_9EURO|nr:uncharacterized protein N7482_002892 [Penicillium canariense]KAJ5177015.1 hypothetical protein N7482_002892 [Penicillium canariense]